MSVPSRRKALGHPYLLVGRVPGGQRTAHVALILVGSVLEGAAVVWCMMGRATGSFFHYKRNFLRLAGLAKVKEGSGGMWVCGGSSVLCSGCGCF